MHLPSLPGPFQAIRGHAAQIVRRITGRVRLFQRVFELMAAK